MFTRARPYPDTEPVESTSHPPILALYDPFLRVFSPAYIKCSSRSLPFMFSDQTLYGMHFLFFPCVPHVPFISSSLTLSSCNVWRKDYEAPHYASIKQEHTYERTFCLHCPSPLPSVASEYSASYAEDTLLTSRPEYRSLGLRSWILSAFPGSC
jgi:hypothetical protein